MFCDVLEQTGLFGLPIEWFYPQRVKTIASRLRTNSFRAYFRHIEKNTRSKNGVFSVNLHIDQYQHWLNKNIDILQLGFDTIFYLYRRDKIAQATSLVKAGITGQWRSTNRLSRQVAPDDLDMVKALEALLKLAREEDFYVRTIRKKYPVAGEYAYEDFCESEVPFFDVIGKCDLSTDGIEFKPSRLGVQRDRFNDELGREVRKFLGIRP